MGNFREWFLFKILLDVWSINISDVWCFRALLHFLDGEKFKSKDDFVERYKNLNSFDEVEVGF